MWKALIRTAGCCAVAAACAIAAHAQDQVVVEDDNGCKYYIDKYDERIWKINTGVSWSGACNEKGFIHGPGVLEISRGYYRSATQMVQAEGKDDPANPSWTRYSYDVHYRKLHTRSKGDEQSTELTSAEGVPGWAHFIFTGEFTRPAPAAAKKENENCTRTVELKPDAETSIPVDLAAYIRGKGGAVPAGVELEEKLAEYRARPASLETATLIAGAEQLFLAVQKCSEGWTTFDAGGCKVRDRYKPQGGEIRRWQGSCLDGYADGPGRLELETPGKFSSVIEAVMWKGLPHGRGFSEEQHGGKTKIVADWEYGVRKQGRITWDNGATYEGRLTGSPLVGTLKYSNGASYSGELVKMQPHGRGRFFYTDDAIGTGTFREGKRHGRVFMQGKNFGKLGYRMVYEEDKIVAREEIYEGGLKKDIFADIANALNIANSALQGLGPAAASGRLRPEQTMALVAAQTAATMATQERPAIPVAASTPAASQGPAGTAASGVLGPQDLEAALAQMAESKRRADEKRRAEQEQAQREAERQRLALAQEERRQAAEQQKQAKQEKQRQAASTRRTETYEVTKTINIPAHSGCIRPNWKKGSHLWTLEFQNTCAFPVQLAWCTGQGCRPGQALTRIPSGGVDRNPGHGSKEHVNWRACQLKSGEFDVVYYSAVDQCQTKIRTTETSVVTPGQR